MKQYVFLSIGFIALLFASCDQQESVSNNLLTPEGLAKEVLSDDNALALMNVDYQISEVLSNGLLEGASVPATDLFPVIESGVNAEEISSIFREANFPLPEKIAALYVERASLLREVRHNYQEILKGFSEVELAKFDALMPKRKPAVTAQEAASILEANN